MPIIDIDWVRPDADDPPVETATRLASALGAVFDSPPGRTWVRLRVLPRWAYAENDVAPDAAAPGPAFVAVLQAQSPIGDARARQAERLTAAVAEVLALPTDRVHVRFEPDGAGRQAFGGHLVR